jgi:putative flippase GtrA
MLKKLNPKNQELWRRRFHKMVYGPAQSSKIALVRYLCVAVAATLLDYAVYVGVVFAGRGGDWAQHPLWLGLAVVLGFAFGGTLNYLLSLHWAFKGAQSGRSAKDQLIFWITAVMGLGINWIVVVALVHTLQMSPEIARIPAILIAFAWNFLSKKWFVFR